MAKKRRVAKSSRRAPQRARNAPGFQMPAHLSSPCGHYCQRGASCPHGVKRYAPTGRWYVTMGHPGFNTPANNAGGYGSEALARGTIARLASPRTNPPRDGKVISRRVMAIDYVHAQSAKGRAYRHRFHVKGVELIGLPDGSLLIRHPRNRLHATFTVRDSE